MARVCLIRQGHYPLDPRVRNEVEALVAAGHEVDVICLRRRGEASYQKMGALTVRRLPIPRQRRNWVWYLMQYAAFLVAAGTLAGTLHLRRRFDVVQVNTIPDSLVLAALIPRVFGARILLDLQECMPEFLATKFRVGMTHPAVRLTALVEQASIRFADFAITCTAQMRQAFVARGASPAKIGVILNSHGLAFADEPTVSGAPSRATASFVLLCHGSIEERYGLDTLLRAAALVHEEIPNLRVEIYGDGSYRPAIVDLVQELGLDQQVFISAGWVPLDELLTAIRDADVGVVATKKDVFRDLTLCNKMFDFIGMRKPAIVSRTRAVEEYFDATCFEMFTADDPNDLARAIRRLYADPALGRQLVERAVKVSEQYGWPGQRRLYQLIVERLADGRKVNDAGLALVPDESRVASR